MSEQLYMPRMCGCGCENAIPTNDPFGPQEYRFDNSWRVWQAGRRWLQKWTRQKKEEPRKGGGVEHRKGERTEEAVAGVIALPPVLSAERQFYMSKGQNTCKTDNVDTSEKTQKHGEKGELGNQSSLITSTNKDQLPKLPLDAREENTIPFPRVPPTGDALLDTLEELERRLGHADPRVNSALVEALQMMGIAMLA